MPRSMWTLYLNESSEEKVQEVVHDFVKIINRPPIEFKREKYFNDGYIAFLQFYHSDEKSWAENVIELIGFGQKIGDNWQLSGDIQEEIVIVVEEKQGDKIDLLGLNKVICNMVRELR